MTDEPLVELECLDCIRRDIVFLEMVENDDVPKGTVFCRHYIRPLRTWVGDYKAPIKGYVSKETHPG